MRKKRKSHPAFLASKSSSENKAFSKLCDLLARRDHSIKELQEKLAQRFEPTAVDEAIQKADEYGYLKDPSEIAQRLAESLHRRGRGHLKILHELHKKGLPEIELDAERENEKARDHLDKLIKSGDDLSFEAKQKAMRFLANRGFLMDTIRQVIDEKF